jgi:hypothetical protein
MASHIEWFRNQINPNPQEWHEDLVRNYARAHLPMATHAEIWLVAPHSTKRFTNLNFAVHLHTQVAETAGKPYMCQQSIGRAHRSSSLNTSTTMANTQLLRSPMYMYIQAAFRMVMCPPFLSDKVLKSVREYKVDEPCMTSNPRRSCLRLPYLFYLVLFYYIFLSFVSCLDAFRQTSFKCIRQEAGA